MNILEWIGKRMIVRRMSLSVAFGLTIWVTLWSIEFAAKVLAAPDVSLADGALLVTAVQAPISVLCGYVFGAYLKSRAE